jgi:hypothetical protein
LDDGLVGRRQCKLREQVVPPNFFPIDVLQGVESLHLAGEPHLQALGIELRDVSRAGAAGK